jgi:EpsI family protein
MFWIGGFWPENIKPATVEAAPAHLPASSGQPAAARKFMLFAACTIACIGIWPAYDLFMYRSQADATPATLTRLHSNWQDSNAFSTWKPSFYPAEAELYRFFQQGSQRVGLSIYYYRNQHQGATLISSANRILPEKNSAWNTLSSTVRTESLSGRPLALREETIQGASGPLLIWHWYWMNGQFIENDYIAKLLQAKSKLTMHGDDGAAIFVFAPYADNPEEARRTLRAFLENNLGPVEATLDGNRKQ